jgi:hypothetical protein
VLYLPVFFVLHHQHRSRMQADALRDKLADLKRGGDLARGNVSLRRPHDAWASAIATISDGNRVVEHVRPGA